MRRIARLRHTCGALITSTNPTTPTPHLRFPSTRPISSTPTTAARPGRFGQQTNPESPESSQQYEPEPQKLENAATETGPSARTPDALLTAEESADVDTLVESQYASNAKNAQAHYEGIPLPPTQRTFAPLPARVDDPTYEPATSSEGLPEVKSLKTWFEDDTNWDEYSRYTAGFAPRVEKQVKDLRVLEVLLRRAVVEAACVVAVGAKEGGERMICRRWGVGGRADLMRALGVGVEVEGGKVKVTGDVEGVVGALEQDDDDDEDEDDEKEEEEGPADVEMVRKVSPYIDGGEAGAWMKTWEKQWKNVSLDDVEFKFAITKRIYQLTGHRIHDYKLAGIQTVGALLKVLLEKPKAVKLFDALQNHDELQALPNVTIYPRRVTPIDKEKIVGRWKVIEQELERRGLPLTGHEHLPAGEQKKWVMGKA